MLPKSYSDLAGANEGKLSECSFQGQIVLLHTLKYVGFLIHKISHSHPHTGALTEFPPYTTLNTYWITKELHHVYSTVSLEAMLSNITLSNALQNIVTQMSFQHTLLQLPCYLLYKPFQRNSLIHYKVNCSCYFINWNNMIFLVL